MERTITMIDIFAQLINFFSNTAQSLVNAPFELSSELSSILF